jgi:hypothetical protein
MRRFGITDLLKPNETFRIYKFIETNETLRLAWLTKQETGANISETILSGEMGCVHAQQFQHTRFLRTFHLRVETNKCTCEFYRLRCIVITLTCVHRFLPLSSGCAV